MKWVTLRELLAFDEGGVLRLLLAPSGQDVRLEGVIIGDEGPERSCAGRIVLATGLTIQEAARRDAAAVVVRGGDVPEDVLSTADEYGIALLARSEWADWDDVATLLRSAIAYAEAGRGDRMADAMEGGGLAALASVVAEFTGGSITIEDTQFRVLAHSATGPEADELRRSTILSGKVPDWRVEELRRSGLLRSLWSSDEVIHRPADGDTPERLIIAIRSGREMLGSIWAAADGRTLTANAASALSRAAEVAVPYLLQHRLRESAARRREEHALRGLLSGDGEMSAHAWSLGLSPDVRCAVVVAEYDGLPGAAAERVMGALALQAASSRGPRGCCASRPGWWPCCRSATATSATSWHWPASWTRWPPRRRARGRCGWARARWCRRRCWRRRRARRPGWSSGCCASAAGWRTAGGTRRPVSCGPRWTCCGCSTRCARCGNTAVDRSTSWSGPIRRPGRAGPLDRRLPGGHR